eukprot:CAMPEP_0197630590 /NCGR_PEP_ID=MMETSP1338-20131121/8022_1 /TAXON_ID=43686 ORGANISM="Pelagodinium beii, Strain RCC1491" /NCGR_SAMPLE_ID=MMETSP1338 /ASSEMBLY_ACC=CAM_ASM_000754 /LENGTH=211 /DNA_ID=CAMNT_0043201839 /DNA_START=99 /DNA_END=734 /DNA_ORIENTATION=-
MNQVGWCKRVQISSRGTGFALFSSPQEAWAAIENLNGAMVMGSYITVDSYAKKKGAYGQPSWGPPGPWDSWQYGKGMGKGMGYGMGKGGMGMDYGSYGMGMSKGMGMGMDMGMGMMGKGMSKGKGKGMEFEVQHPEKTVWLGNLAPGTTHQDLLPVMNQVGNCRRVQVGKKGTGFAFFSSAEEAQAAIDLNGSMVNGSSIAVDRYTSKRKY